MWDACKITKENWKQLQDSKLIKIRQLTENPYFDTLHTIENVQERIHKCAGFPSHDLHPKKPAEPDLPSVRGIANYVNATWKRAPKKMKLEIEEGPFPGSYSLKPKPLAMIFTSSLTHEHLKTGCENDAGF